jgi:hypothetical protein
MVVETAVTELVRAELAVMFVLKIAVTSSGPVFTTNETNEIMTPAASALEEQPYSNEKWAFYI